MRERILERIRKVWALAQLGEGGEKEAAGKILEKMLSDNGMSLDDLLIEEKEIDFKVTLKKDFDLRLLMQVYFKVSNAENIKRYIKGKTVHFLATHAHGIETLSLFSLYRVVLQKDMELFYEAFIHKNNIFSEIDNDDGEETTKEFTPEEEKEMWRLIKMMGAIDRVDVHKMIEKRV